MADPLPPSPIVALSRKLPPIAPIVQVVAGRPDLGIGGRTLVGRDGRCHREIAGDRTDAQVAARGDVRVAGSRLHEKIAADVMNCKRTLTGKLGRRRIAENGQVTADRDVIRQQLCAIT